MPPTLDPGGLMQTPHARLQSYSWCGNSTHVWNDPVCACVCERGPSRSPLMRCHPAWKHSALRHKRWWEERVEADWLDGLRTHARKEERHKTETLRRTHNGDKIGTEIWWKNICGNSLTSLQERKITSDTGVCSPRQDFTHLHNVKSLKYVLKARPACQHFRTLGMLSTSIHLGRLWFWYQKHISLFFFSLKCTIITTY